LQEYESLSNLPTFTVTESIGLKPSPINPNWIIEGAPIAKTALLSGSPDGKAITVMWECSPGRFDWFYNWEETLHIYEGDVILDEGLPTERHVGPGDTVFFPAGSHALWHVREPVRKIAFCRASLPKPVYRSLSVLRRIKRKLMNWRSDPNAQQEQQQAGFA
jgi:uncharacterized cupin superfamily protein